MSKWEAIFKYNGGAGALLCNVCRKIIKTGGSFTEEEWRGLRGEVKLSGQICEGCREELTKLLNDVKNNKDV